MVQVRDQLKTAGLCHVLHRSANNSVVIQDKDFSVSAVRNIGDYKSIDSVRVGNFIPGIFRVNPVTIKHGQASCTSGYLKFRSSYNGCGAIMEVTGPYMAFRGKIPYGAVDNNLVAQALAKAYAKSKDAEFNAIVALGEIKETLELLRNPLSSIVRALAKAPGPYPGSRRLIDGLSGAWLTWWYGIMPLVKDAENLINLITAKKRGLGLRRVRATVKATSTSTTSTKVGVSSFSFSSDEQTITTHKTSAVVYFAVNVKGIKPFEGPRALGMSLDQLPVNLWELVPFSFVVDWLFDVGAWLANMSPASDIQYVGNSVSSKITCSFRATPGNPMYCSSYTPTEYQPSIYTSETNTLVRVVNQLVPALPVFRGALSLKNTVTSLALLCANMPKSWQRR